MQILWIDLTAAELACRKPKNSIVICRLVAGPEIGYPRIRLLRVGATIDLYLGVKMPVQQGERKANSELFN